jgi:hypothetical protein
MSVISEMYSVGAVPDSFTWTALRTWALQHHDVEGVEKADRELRAMKGTTAEEFLGSSAAEENNEEGREPKEKHWQGYYYSYNDDEDDW